MLVSKPLVYKHIISARQFSKDWLISFLHFVDKVRGDHTIIAEEYYRNRRANTTAYLIFYQSSTRTRFSFTHAANDLGISTIFTENAREFSSAVKGENLEDTIRVCCEYGPRFIVLRHHEALASFVAIDTVKKWGYGTRIINAGDGSNEHPTQALTDLYTIWCELGRVSDLNIVVGGDLHGRAARSLIFLLSLFSGLQLTLISPKTNCINEDVKKFLKERDVEYTERNKLLGQDLGVADVVYWTRPQLERESSLRTVKEIWDSDDFIFGAKQLEDLSKHAIIMHPLPRTKELSPEVDHDSRARYFKQAGYGKDVRTVLMMSGVDDLE